MKAVIASDDLGKVECNTLLSPGNIGAVDKCSCLDVSIGYCVRAVRTCEGDWLARGKCCVR